MDFKQAFAGFDEATPDGTLPKINAWGNDGTYDLEIKKHGTFKSVKAGGQSFKFECVLLAASNNKFPVGTDVSIVIHNLISDKQFSKAKAFGNMKSLLAAAASSVFKGEISPYAAQPSSDCTWLDLITMACENETTFEGGRIRVQITSSRAGQNQDGNQFGKIDKCEPLPMAAAQAA